MVIGRDAAAAMAQTVIGSPPPTLDAWFRSQSSPWAFMVDKVVLGEVFRRVLR